MCLHDYQDYCKCCKKGLILNPDYPDYKPPYPPNKVSCTCGSVTLILFVDKKCHFCDLYCYDENVCVNGVLPNFVFYFSHSKKFQLFYDHCNISYFPGTFEKPMLMSNVQPK